MYIYKTQLYKEPSQYEVDLPSDNNTNKVDFETNGKPIAYKINAIELAETAIIIEKTYAQFKALIVSPTLWSDVKYIEDGLYELFLLSENPL